jgi:hypothetical protein
MIRLQVNQMIGTIVTVWLSECSVDWIKHAFITKFNHMSTDCYANFTSILRDDIVNANSSKVQWFHFLLFMVIIGLRTR